jgi:hypothetical protein
MTMATGKPPRFDAIPAKPGVDLKQVQQATAVGVARHDPRQAALRRLWEVPASRDSSTGRWVALDAGRRKREPEELPAMQLGVWRVDLTVDFDDLPTECEAVIVFFLFDHAPAPPLEDTLLSKVDDDDVAIAAAFEQQNVQAFTRAALPRPAP